MKTEQITNLYLINSKYIVFKQYGNVNYEPSITEPITTAKKIDPFLVDFNGSKLIIFTIQINQDTDLLILQQINNKYYILYPNHFNLENNYYVTGIHLVNIITQRKLNLFDLPESEKDRLNLLYFEYHDHNKPIDIKFMKSLLIKSLCQECKISLPSKSYDTYSIYHLINHSKRRYSNNNNIPASKYNNVKIYGIIADYERHYSFMDIASYNKQLKNFNTNLTIESIEKNKLLIILSFFLIDVRKSIIFFFISSIIKYNKKLANK